MEQMSSGRLSEAIAFQIAELILSGQIESGTKLRQEELAKMLEVSRIPVREALQLLETQGLAKRLVTRHIVTADLDDVHVRETYAMIAAMEKNADDHSKDCQSVCTDAFDQCCKLLCTVCRKKEATKYLYNAQRIAEVGYGRRESVE